MGLQGLRLERNEGGGVSVVVMQAVDLPPNPIGFHGGWGGRSGREPR